MFQRTRARKVLVLVGLSVLFTLPLLAQSRMTVRREERHDVSPPLRDMIAQAPRQVLTRHEAEPARRIPLPPGLVTLPDDPVRQRPAASIAAFAPVVSRRFDCLGNGPYCFSVACAPSDSSG